MDSINYEKRYSGRTVEFSFPEKCNQMRTGQLDSRPCCPGCKTLLDGFAAVDHDEKPKAGDVTICVYCNQVLQFNDDMSMKPASPDVIEECGLLGIRDANDLYLAEEIRDSQKETAYIRKNFEGEFEADFSEEYMDA